MITIDSAIVTIIISAAVSFGLFGLKERWIEPGRCRKNIQIAELEKKLEVYGTLNTLLQSFYEKSHKVTIHSQNNDQHENKTHLNFRTMLTN